MNSGDAFFDCGSAIPCPGWAEYTEETARLTVARRNNRDGALVWAMGWCNGHWHVYRGRCE